MPALAPSLAALADRLQSMILVTPTVPFEDEATGCTIWMKLEYLQPSGSTKDRLAAHVLGEGVRSGEIDTDTLVVEASSGSTSIAFAMGCALLGLSFRAVMPKGVSRERILMIQRYGAEVVLTDREKGIAGAMDATREMAERDRRIFLPRQFENPGNVAAHAIGTGPELLAAVGRELDGFVAGVGTAGTLMGVAQAIRAAGHHRTSIARVRPTTGMCFAGQPEICIAGVVEGASSLLDRASVGLADDLHVPDDDAMEGARALCRLGFPVGVSSGLNVAGARLLASRLGPGHHVATVLSDRMERYFSTGLFDDLPTP